MYSLKLKASYTARILHEVMTFPYENIKDVVL